MSKRTVATVLAICLLPYLLGADWLITTHSGDDVLTYESKSESLEELVKPGTGGLKQARGFTFGPSGDLFVCSAAAVEWAVLRYNAKGDFKGSFAAGSGLSHPYQCLFGPDGQLYVSGQNNNAVLRFDGKTGRFKDVFVKPGAGGLDGIRGIAFHPEGDLLVAGRDNNAILRFNGKTGESRGFFVAADDGKLEHPIQLRYGPDDYLYVSSGKNSRIVRYHGLTGKLIDVFVKHKSGGLAHPSGFDWAANGDLYVASRDSDQILRYDGTTGKFKDVVLSHKHDKRIKSPEFIMRLEKGAMGD
ncbi:MAG: NHL repeat-containing protein [Pirellulales bacterium]|nr:NHL repeat-containing protein [Pirellulales bacterium]